MRNTQFLEKYLSGHNRRFSIPAKADTNLHRVESKSRLKQILSVQTSHVLRNDNTIRHDNRFYQILRPWKYRRPKQILFEERLDGKLYLTHEGKDLPWRLIPEPAPQMVEQRVVVPFRRPSVPPMEHPYKRQSFQRYLKIKKLREQKQNRTLLMVAN